MEQSQRVVYQNYGQPTGSCGQLWRGENAPRLPQSLSNPALVAHASSGGDDEGDEEDEGEETAEEAYRRRQWVLYYVSVGQFSEAEDIGWDGRDPPDPRVNPFSALRSESGGGSCSAPSTQHAPSACGTGVGGSLPDSASASSKSKSSKKSAGARSEPSCDAISESHESASAAGASEVAPRDSAPAAVSTSKRMGQKLFGRKVATQAAAAAHSALDPQ